MKMSRIPDWSKKKIFRDVLLENFVIQKSLQYQLSRNVSIHLLSLILLGLVFKVLTIKDFVITGNKITTIHGFHFQTGRIFITKNIFRTTFKNRNHLSLSSESPQLMSSYWNIYLQDLKSSFFHKS